jgi:RNA polymerase sigma-70 factor (ECF subfamily)
MDSSERDTRRLVDLAREGDVSACERLFRAYSAKLEAAIKREMNEPLRAKMDAADVLQETYLEALRDFATFEYRGKGSLYAWFRQISRNKIRELHRHFFRVRKRAAGREATRARRPRGETEQGTVERHPASGTTPTGAARRREGAAEIALRLARLPRDYRLVISLVRIEELPISEAARVMGRSENAVKKLLARALEQLRAEFEKDGLTYPLG